MNQFMFFHQARADALTNNLSACADVREACDCAVRYLDALCEDYCAQDAPAALRKRARGLIAVAKAAVEAMAAVDRADFRLLPGPAPSKSAARVKRLLGYLPGALMAAIAVWAFFSNQTNLALAALVACGVSAFFAREVERPILTPPRVEATPAVSCDQLARRIAFALREIDAQLYEEEAPASCAPALTRPMLEALQMLFEAQLTSDPAFALKVTPQIADALKRQGVELKLYDAQSAKDFDLLPAMTGGETIRPAIKQDETLLLRGQATVKI
ncbi:MAG: hypothetical protein RSJ41_07545 [Clostridia bacterium]